MTRVCMDCGTSMTRVLPDRWTSTTKGVACQVDIIDTGVGKLDIGGKGVDGRPSLDDFFVARQMDIDDQGVAILCDIIEKGVAMGVVDKGVARQRDVVDKGASKPRNLDGKVCCLTDGRR